MVELEGDAGQVARVLQKREQREENRHRRQHDRDDGGQHAPHAVGQQRHEEGRQADCGKPRRDRFGQAEQPVAQPLAGHVGAEQRDVEYQREQQQHQRNAEPPAHQHAVDAAVAQAGAFALQHAGHCDFLGPQGGRGGQHVVDLLGGHALGWVLQ